ncbi:MAG: molybdopterin converting factor subunit 1 [Deltaproteobacteria bacterium]|nr:molybdopterin converting factor subunit 1 [Deltaproteobacteria bacterium]
MTIRLLYFASLRERLRRREGSCTLGAGATVEDLWQELCREYPQLVPLAGAIRFSVNLEYVERHHVLSDNDEVALIPPVSGG